ncbi:MAG: ABC transporter permease [Bryobacteraceae bacterium]
MRTFTEQLLQDLRYGLRSMGANRGFTAMAVLSLALGIGANAAIYSFMDAILMRALPVQDPESLVVLRWRAKERPSVVRSLSGTNYRDANIGYNSGNFPYPAYETLRTNHAVLSTIFAFAEAGRLNLQIHGQPDLANGQYISGNYFHGLGVPPTAGGLIAGEDDRFGSASVAVLSYRYASRRFGEAAKAVGQPVLINNTPFTIAGVAAPEFFGINPGSVIDIYLPMRASALLETSRDGDSNRKYIDGNYYWVEMMGRLRPGVNLRQAQAALTPAFHQFVAATANTEKEGADFPALLFEEGAGGLDFLRRQYSKPLFVLMTMVGLILTIACANIANLLLARATARRREMAVRLSVGAGRSRLIRQLLTESVLLAALGGAIGILFAHSGIRFLTLLIANGRANFTLHAELNWNVLGVAIALALGTGVLFGLAPALQASRVDLTTALKQTRGAERHRSVLRLGLSRTLVVSQMAISLLLLVAAGLFVRTLSNLHAVQLGFNQERLLLFSLDARQAGYQGDALVRFYDTLQARLSAIPGVRSVTLSGWALVSGSGSYTSAEIPGTSKTVNVSTLPIGPSFFTTMEIPVLLGRAIERRDLGARGIAVVNEQFVKSLFAGENPIGKRFRMNGSDFEIIGVSANARYQSLKGSIPATVYVAYGQGVRSMHYELRSAGDPLALTSSVREVVRQADARIPITNLMTQEGQIRRQIGQERTFATLCASFAILAVLIACVGLYGTMSYNVARRTGEIGIRIALGAERHGVIWMVLREVLTLAGAGLAIGLPAAWSAARLVETFLFGVKAQDPLAMSLAPAILVAAAIAAGYGPAWRASRIQPVTALRHEQ